MSATAAANTSCQITLCTTDIIQTALFLCLRSCEYTKTQSHRRIVQFRLQDMQFNDAGGVVSQDVPDKHFFCARDFTLSLNTHKNFVQGESTTMEATNLEHGNPVSSDA